MKTHFQKTYFLVLVILMVGCTNNPDIIPEASDLKLRAGLEKRVVQDNEFAFDLLRKTIADVKDTNVFMSPLSVSMALGMTMNGAVGTTRTEMENALKLSGLSVEDINEYYKAMQTQLPVIDPLTKLSLANSIWYRSGFAVKKTFLETNKNYFDAEVRELDFAQSWAKDTINNWVARKTNDLIKDILDIIPKDAVMYLVNAVYFKGTWKIQFDPKETRESYFTNEAGKQLKVNMMQLKDTFAYAKDEYAQYIDLPYGNGAFSMTIILPDYDKSTAEVLSSMSGERWNNIVTGLVKQEAAVFLPRFTTKNKFLLNNPLINMGMPKAFTAGAEFNNIADDDLMISRVLHDTYIEVTEEGTEAAAATVVEMNKTSIPEFPTVNVNRPFVFVIREKSTGVILFAGKIGELTKF